MAGIDREKARAFKTVLLKTHNGSRIREDAAHARQKFRIRAADAAHAIRREEIVGTRKVARKVLVRLAGIQEDRQATDKLQFYG